MFAVRPRPFPNSHASRNPRDLQIQPRRRNWFETLKPPFPVLMWREWARLHTILSVSEIDAGLELSCLPVVKRRNADDRLDSGARAKRHIGCLCSLGRRQGADRLRVGINREALRLAILAKRWLDQGSAERTCTDKGYQPTHNTTTLLLQSIAECPPGCSLSTFARRLSSTYFRNQAPR